VVHQVAKAGQEERVVILLGKLAAAVKGHAAGRRMRGEAVHRMIAQQTAGPDVLNWRLKLHPIRWLESVLVIRLFAVAEDVRKAVMLALLNVIEFFRMVRHGAILGVDEPALVIPVKTKRIS